MLGQGHPAGGRRRALLLQHLPLGGREGTTAGAEDQAATAGPHAQSAGATGRSALGGRGGRIRCSPAVKAVRCLLEAPGVAQEARGQVMACASSFAMAAQTQERRSGSCHTCWADCWPAPACGCSCRHRCGAEGELTCAGSCQAASAGLPANQGQPWVQGQVRHDLCARAGGEDGGERDGGPADAAHHLLQAPQVLEYR